MIDANAKPNHGRTFFFSWRQLFFALLCWMAIHSAALAQSPPASFTASFTNGGSVVTVDFTLHSIRSATFSVLVQNSSGAFDPYLAPAAATYLGTPVGYPGAMACATRKANGTLLARIFFENGVTWTTTAGTMAGGSASASGSANWTRKWPGFTMLSGGAGSNEYAAELGIDSSFDHFNRSALNVNDNLSIIEHSVLCANVLYLRDAGILHRLGRIVMRGDQFQDPYRNLTGGALLNEMANQWNNVLPPSTHDVAAMISAGSVGGGLAWVGVIGTSSRYSVNDSDSNGDFSVIWRHEVGHNWGANHYEGNAPEGPTIMSDNGLGRISSPELRKIVDHRNTKLAILDNLGSFSFPLPPRASLDFGSAAFGASTTFNVLGNDHDDNGQAISILSFDAVSYLGAPISQAGGNLAVQSTADHGQMDWFEYRISDTAGRTATGIVYVQGENPSTQLTGTGIGTAGTWCCNNTFDKALDGNLTTFYDADSATGDWAGLDLGAGNTKAVTKIKYAARAGNEGRMDGGVFQGSSSATFSTGVVTLFTISGAPSSGVLTSQAINNNTAYRYVRYLGPANGFCNVAEIEFWGADPAAPNPPNALVANGVASGQINVSWNSSAFAASYNVKRASISGGPYGTVATGVTATNFNDSGLTPGATYYYVVSAVNTIGQSGNSAEASSIASPIPTSDWRFDEGTGTIAIDSASGQNHGTVNGAVWIAGFAGTSLQFNGINNSVTFGTGPSVSGQNNFTVAAWIKTTASASGVIIQQRDQAGFNGQYRFQVNGNGALQFMVYGDSAYQFDFATAQTVNDGAWHHVVAVRDRQAGRIHIDGNPTPAGSANGTAVRNLSSSISTAVGRDIRDSVLPFNGSIDEVLIYKTIALAGSDIQDLYNSYLGTQPPPAPTSLAAAGGNAVVNLNWTQSTGSGIAQNKVYRSTTGSGGPYNLLATLAATTSYSDTAVVNGNTYFYTISAVNVDGESAQSAFAGATPTAAPATPTGLSASPSGKKKIQLTWTASAGATSYNIKRALVSGGPYTAIATGVTTTSYLNTGLTTGTTYYYVVSAVNGSGESANSSQASATAR
jgi:fibronectin type 3 domain-containing protein